MTLHAKNLGWSRGGHFVLDQVTIDPDAGETIGLLGPNGSGKSSLLRLLSGIAAPTPTTPTSGTSGDGRSPAGWRWSTSTPTPRSASPCSTWSGSANIPHRGMFGDDTADDLAVENALAHTGMSAHTHRLWHSLTGGERQRAQIARALAPQQDELLLDELTNHLDIAHQLDILALVGQLPLTSYIALHDLNPAAMFCNRMVVLDGGRIVAAGPPAEVITETLVEQVYRVRAAVTIDAQAGYPTVTYRPQTARNLADR